MSIQYNQDELLTFQYFFNLCDQSGQGVLPQDMVINFFKASQLNQQILGAIWGITSTNGTTFSKDEFFAALKLIALAQNNYPPDVNLLSQNIATPLPILQGFQPPKYDIQVEQLQKYETYFHSIDQEGTQIVQGMQARALFSKSGLTRDQLSQLWTLCDIGEKGHLSKGEFLIALHLIQLVSKQKYPLPITLPDALIQIARRFSSGQNGPRLGSNQNLGQPQQRFGSNSNILNQPRPRLGSNAGMVIQPIQPIQTIPQQQSIIQPLNIASNVSMIPGYDSQGMNLQRQQINDSTQSLFQMQTQLTSLYSSFLAEKSEDMRQMQTLNDNLKIMLANLQEQFRVINDEIAKIRQQKSGLMTQNQQLQQQVTMQSQQNKELLVQFQNEMQQFNQQPQQQYQQPITQPQYSAPYIQPQQQTFASPEPQTNIIKIQPAQNINQFQPDDFQKVGGILKPQNIVEPQKKQVTFAEPTEQFPW